MNPAILETRLNELLSEFSEKPAQKNKKTQIITLKTRRKKKEEEMDTLAAQLDNIQFHIKYVMFDLESTRRENGYLRRILEEQD